MGEGGGDHGSENHVKPGSFEKSRGGYDKEPRFVWGWGGGAVKASSIVATRDRATV